MNLVSRDSTGASQRENFRVYYKPAEEATSRVLLNRLFSDVNFISADVGFLSGHFGRGRGFRGGGTYLEQPRVTLVVLALGGGLADVSVTIRT